MQLVGVGAVPTILDKTVALTALIGTVVPATFVVTVVSPIVVGTPVLTILS